MKDRVYNFLVRRDERIQYEYERYVMEHIAEHYEKRGKHWKILWCLNWHYRIQRKNDPLLYWTKEAAQTEHRRAPVIRKASLSTEEGKQQSTAQEPPVEEEYTGGDIFLEAKEVGAGRVSLAWNHVKGIEKYIVWKYDEKAKRFRQDGTAVKPQFNVRKLCGDTKYKFRVTGITALGEEVLSNVIKVTTLYPIKQTEANPYMDGSESALSDRRTVHFLAKELQSYDVISFDVFDTLILRPFAGPGDLFMMLDERFDMLGFASIRQRAEMTVRDLAEKTKGNREVTIDEIYAEIERRTGIEKEAGKQTEVKLECDLCFANPYMHRLFELLKYAGKKIILISDMYFTSDIIEKMLSKCGYFGYEELFVSCEHNSNKYSGTLYGNVKNKLGTQLRYIHIGDNQKADIKAAQRAGMETIYYRSCNELGNKYRASQYGMQRLIGSAYSGIVNAALHNGLNKFSVYYEYGYLYGGLYVYGFCQWIHRYAAEHDLDKVLFFARDGYIYKKVYDRLFTDIPSEYVFSSRIANSVLCAEKQRDNFLIRNIEVKASYELKTTIGNFFDIFDLHFLDCELKKYGLKLYHDISESNKKILEQFVIDHWEQIIVSLEESSIAYRSYIMEKIKGCTSTAVVDTGWQGTTLLGMKWLIETKWNTGCKVHCLMAAAQTANPIVNQTQLMTNEIAVYLFSSNFNRDAHQFHQKMYKNNITSYLFELFTQAPHATFSKITIEEGREKFQFGIPEVENYQMINEIHRGIEDFCSQYHEAFHAYPYMNNISGHDAYVPFRFIAKNPRMFKQFFMDFAYSKSTGGDVTNQNMETMRHLFES